MGCGVAVLKSRTEGRNGLPILPDTNQRRGSFCSLALTVLRNQRFLPSLSLSSLGCHPSAEGMELCQDQLAARYLIPQSMCSFPGNAA